MKTYIWAIPVMVALAAMGMVSAYTEYVFTVDGCQVENRVMPTWAPEVRYAEPLYQKVCTTCQIAKPTWHQNYNADVVYVQTAWPEKPCANCVLQGPLVNYYNTY